MSGPGIGHSWMDGSLFGDKLDVLEKLDAVLESSYDGIYITDGAANTVRVNKSYETISGLNREDVLGKNMRDLVEKGVMSSSGTLLALATKQPVTLEQKFKTGKRAVITSTPTFDSEGSVVLVVTNVRDITELHSLKKQLSKEEELTQKQLSEIEVIRKQIVGSGDMVAVDKNMLKTMLVVNKVASMDTAVLLLGETGVGKEKVATYIYNHSPRNKERFIKVNCGAIPQHLMESELFGYEGGAFTGADKNGKMGLFEVADKGTIFLDEVGELSLDMQVKLLRVLQDKEVNRVGSTRARKIDVRILAATNRDLEEMVENKLFRKDLYYRLNVFPVTILPLRERREDIMPLAESILAELNREYNLKKEFSMAATLLLRDYQWPGNVRELRNVVERAVILSSENAILPQDLAIHATPLALEENDVLPDTPISLKGILEEVEASYIAKAYAKHRNIRKAAGSLGMDAATYVRKRKKYMEKSQSEADR